MNTSPLVLVVGGGPTGLTAAMELSRFGIPVRIVERLLAPSTTSRALAVQARTLELLDARGPGAEMLRLGNRAVAATLHGDRRVLGRVRLDEIRSRHNYVLTLAQSETERLLAEQCARQGVAVERGVVAIAIGRHAAPGGPDRASAVLRHADGRLEEVQADAVICAEGAHSLLRHTLALPFDGESLPQDYALGDVRIAGALPDDELSIFANAHGFLALFPFGEGRFRLIATHAPEADPAAAADPTLAQLQSLYDRDVYLPGRLHDLAWSSRFRINSRMLQRLRVGPFFFGGDAAHVHSPAGGQGMNTCIQDMIGLGWKLALVLRGRAAPALLETYEPERLAVIRSVVDKTEKATDVINADNPVAHALLTHLAPWLLKSDLVQETATSLIGELAANYRASALSEDHRRHDDLRAGDRVPDPRVVGVVPSGEARIAPLQALLDASRLTLLVTGADAAKRLAALAVRFAPWHDVMDLRAIAPIPGEAGAADAFDALFGREAGLRVVRPDGYLGYAGDASDLATLANWLQRWFPSA